MMGMGLALFSAHAQEAAVTPESIKGKTAEFPADLGGGEIPEGDLFAPLDPAAPMGGDAAARRDAADKEPVVSPLLSDEGAPLTGQGEPVPEFKAPEKKQDTKAAKADAKPKAPPAAAPADIPALPAVADTPPPPAPPRAVPAKKAEKATKPPEAKKAAAAAAAPPPALPEAAPPDG